MGQITYFILLLTITCVFSQSSVDLECAAEHNTYRGYANAGTVAPGSTKVQPIPITPLVDMTSYAAGISNAKDFLDYLNTGGALCANVNNFQHCGNLGSACIWGPGEGENFYATASSSSTPAANCNNAVKSWYSEIDDFNFFGASTPGRAIGHYTQIVWAGTLQVGCASLRCSTKATSGPFLNMYSTFILCRYAPVGNCNGGRPYSPQCNCEVACSPKGCAASDRTCPPANFGSTAAACACAYGSSCVNGTCVSAPSTPEPPAPSPIVPPAPVPSPVLPPAPVPSPIVPPAPVPSPVLPPAPVPSPVLPPAPVPSPVLPPAPVPSPIVPPAPVPSPVLPPVQVPSPASSTDPIIWWKFDETSGNTASNSAADPALTGRRYSGSFSGAGLVTSSGCALHPGHNVRSNVAASSISSDGFSANVYYRPSSVKPCSTSSATSYSILTVTDASAFASMRLFVQVSARPSSSGSNVYPAVYGGCNSGTGGSGLSIYSSPLGTTSLLASTNYVMGLRVTSTVSGSTRSFTASVLVGGQVQSSVSFSCTGFPDTFSAHAQVGASNYIYLTKSAIAPGTYTNFKLFNSASVGLASAKVSDVKVFGDEHEQEQATVDPSSAEISDVGTGGFIGIGIAIFAVVVVVVVIVVVIVVRRRRQQLTLEQF